jgi:hypothetical protein
MALFWVTIGVAIAAVVAVVGIVASARPMTREEIGELMRSLMRSIEGDRLNRKAQDRRPFSEKTGN